MYNQSYLIVITFDVVISFISIVLTFVIGFVALDWYKTILPQWVTHFIAHFSNTRFFNKQRFFLTQPQCYLIFSWIQLQMLLTAYNHHHTETHFIFSIFVSMYWHSSIYVIIFEILGYLRNFVKFNHYQVSAKVKLY